MPFALITIGLALIVSGIKNTQSQLGAQVVKDFTGAGNFIYWVLAIFCVGALGYIPQLDKFSKAFMGLIIVALFISNKGFFSQFTVAIQSGTANAPTTTTNTTTTNSALAGSAISDLSSLFSGGL